MHRCPERGLSVTGWTALALRGDHSVDLETIAGAVSPDFIAGAPQVLQVPTDTTGWQAVDRDIATKARELLAGDNVFDPSVGDFPSRARQRLHLARLSSHKPTACSAIPASPRHPNMVLASRRHAGARHRRLRT